MHLRTYRPQDAAACWALKRDTIRRVNSRDYSAEQVSAWEPTQHGLMAWPARMEGRYGVVVEEAGTVLGFADLGSDGYVDQFFVHADHQRRGIGRLLFGSLLTEARRRGIARLFSNVSLTARPFFEAHGFSVEVEQTANVNGVSLKNYRMSRVI